MPSTALYYALLVLNLAGLLMFMRVNQMLHDEYTELAAENVVWTVTNQRTVALGQAAQAANAPVNEVFNSRNHEFERERLRMALDDLTGLVKRERQALDGITALSQRQRLLLNLETAQANLQWMTSASQRVFDELKSGKRDAADSAMAMADRKFGDFLEVMAQRSLIIQGIQADLFLRDEQYRSSLNNLVLVGIVLLAGLAVVVAGLGIRLQRAARRSATEARKAAAALQTSELHRQELHEQREKLLASRQQFLADAAHQLRTPVAGIKLQVERALKTSDPQVVHEALAQLHGASDRAVRLSNQLLTLASADPGSGGNTEFKDINLAELVREVGMRWMSLAHDRNIELELDAPEAPVPVRGNAVLLGELVSNLIDNAVRYLPDYGNINLIVHNNPAPRLLVEDTGPGIPPDQREKVFERFHRIPGSPGTGSGLGLAIVKDIAHLHQAVVTLEQPDGGHGLRVRIDFPGRPVKAQDHPRGGPALG